MKAKRKAAILLTVSMITSMSGILPVNAQELDTELPILEETGNYCEAEEVGSLEQYKADSFNDVILNDMGISLADTTGDSYEANNGPAVATSGRYNKLTYASIHEENDVDWYTFEITDVSEPISVFLTNIPSGCNYDMYLVQYDSTNGITAMYYNIQSGNTSEYLYGTVSEAGTYYVVVQPDTSDTSIEDNYSSSNYTLYMGDYYRTGQYGYVDTGLDISFGYIAVGNTTAVYKGWYTYDMSNVTSVPDDAIATKIYLTDDGNGAYWLGFYKILAAGGQGIRLDEKVGQIDVMYTYDEDNLLLVKQQWLIGGHILASTNFVWEPQILFAYKYGATISNLKFL